MKPIIAALVLMSMLLVFTIAPRPASAQCAGMGGGGHDHSATRAQETKKSSGSPKKLQQSIDRLLADDQGRAMLADALIDDQGFVEDFIRRMAAIPAWRSMAAQQLGSGAPGVSESAPKPALQGASLYVCPMHPEVTSATAGDCPKCGMKLERRPSNSK